MSQMVLMAVTAPIALAAATAKTCVQLTAATNHAVKLKRWGVTFDGVTAAAVPVLVEIVRQTTAGTMSSLTLVKSDTDRTGTIQTTAQHTATVEPTTTDVLDRVLVHPQSGYVYVAPFGDEEIIPANTRLGLRVTAPAVVNVVAVLRLEE